MKRHTHQEVKNIFKEAGCTLLEPEYKRNSIPMRYICKCGNESKISLANFKNGKRCVECGRKKLRDLQLKHTIETVKSFFAEKGCVLLAEEYENVDAKMPYICECGNRSEINFSEFRIGKRCMKCGHLRQAESAKKPLEEIQQLFKSKNAELLETSYHGKSHRPLVFKCFCGNVHSISYANAKQKKYIRCRDCYIDSQSGKNSHMWNAELTDEERIYKRDYPEYKKWRSSVFARDNYTCRCCEKANCEVNAHHIVNYHADRDKRLDTNNGITLCRECHYEFHDTYGYKNNTKKQLLEYFEKKKIHS